jgi:glucans biosynthesis protein
VAPLTSMFLHGENAGRRFDDFRPEVHDSDGLLMETGSGEFIWRPLTNPANLAVSSFQDKTPRGFGLLQRDRSFDSYQDLQANYHRRPSYWVEPRSDWGEGSIRLVEIPSDAEIHDNIVAFWVPAAPVKADQPLDFAYRLHGFADAARISWRGRVAATRIGGPGIPGAHSALPRGSRRFVIEFNQGDLGALRPEQPVETVVETSSGEIKNLVTMHNPEQSGFRAVFDFVPDGRKPADIRSYLRLYGEALTETWTYSLRP